MSKNQLLEYLKENDIEHSIEGDALTVGRYLDLQGTGITSLPDNLSVGGSLYLQGTGITSLPDNLSVGWYLYLQGTGIPIWQKDNIGSRDATLYGVMWSDKPALVTGCFFDTVEVFLEKVKKVHGDNEHGRAYRQAVAEFIEVVNK